MTGVVDKPADRISVGYGDGLDASLRPDESAIVGWCLNALEGQPDNTFVDVRLVDEDEMADLNGSYRGKPRPTNVLSFPALDGGITDGVPVAHLGDIAVCPAVLMREIAEQSKTFDAHFAHMMTHGILHLLGHDHIDEADAERMEQLERTILARIGIADPYQQES